MARAFKKDFSFTLSDSADEILCHFLIRNILNNEKFQNTYNVMKNNLNYKVTGRLNQPEFITKSENISKFAKRDINHLQELGITIPLLTDFDDKVKTLIAMDSHRANVIIGNDATKQRDTKAIELVQFTERIRAQVSILYTNNGSSEYTILNKAISTLNINGLITLGRDTLSLLNQKADEVALYGLTAEKIAAYKTIVDELHSLNSLREGMKKSFNNTTQARLQLKSEIYKTLNFISKVGMAYWKRIDPAIYSDYFLNKYKSPPKKVRQSEQGNEATSDDSEITSSSF